MAFEFPIVQDSTVEGIPFQRPGLRQRLQTYRYVEYVVEYDVANRIPGGTLESISAAVFGDAKSWYAMGDVNKLRDPFDWNTGDTMKIPVDIL